MKIRVNYDLIDKIRESKTGLSLKRSVNKYLCVSSIAIFLFSPKIIFSDNPNQELIESIFAFAFLSFINGTIDNLVLKKTNREKSISDLKQLASLLRKHYINTDYELLQNAYNYETNYSFMLDENKIPRLKQEKFINVPVVDRDGEKEVSLVQEHLIGSRDYELSYGSPTKSKVLKPVYNGI